MYSDEEDVVGVDGMGVDGRVMHHDVNASTSLGKAWLGTAALPLLYWSI